MAYRQPSPYPIVPEEAAAYANDPETGYLYYQLPRSSPVYRHRGPGVFVLSNPKRKRAYAVTARESVRGAAQGLLARLRHQILVESGRKPLARHDGKLTLPPALLVDWERDRPESFTWLLPVALENGDGRLYRALHARGLVKTGQSNEKALRHYLERVRSRVIAAILEQGWTAYNKSAPSPFSLPGAGAAMMARKRAEQERAAEIRRNHIRFWDLCDERGVLLDDPRDPDVQRAWARECARQGTATPRPGDPMRGRTKHESVAFALPHGELQRDCPGDACPNRRLDTVS